MRRGIAPRYDLRICQSREFLYRFKLAVKQQKLAPNLHLVDFLCCLRPSPATPHRSHQLFRFPFVLPQEQVKTQPHRSGVNGCTTLSSRLAVCRRDWSRLGAMLLSWRCAIGGSSRDETNERRPHPTAPAPVPVCQSFKAALSPRYQPPASYSGYVYQSLKIAEGTTITFGGFIVFGGISVLGRAARKRHLACARGGTKTNGIVKPRHRTGSRDIHLVGRIQCMPNGRARGLQHAPQQQQEPPPPRVSPSLIAATYSEREPYIVTFRTRKSGGRGRGVSTTPPTGDGAGHEMCASGFRVQ
ncbi:hypothetical protein GEV33_012273 [Tenebrio molitor]|uniref:Uncharacterized protein n=1 Tax=Tenebrio molitor TaxID=7067 RepID=A0A8J6HA32_TENMO|nr:hypothetical protein GEV33_012273 [Tenebrio molitor]